MDCRYRRRTQKELDRIRRSLGKVECLPTGEEQMLESGKVYIFGGPITSLLRNEEEMGANLIKEARDRTVD